MLNVTVQAGIVTHRKMSQNTTLEHQLVKNGTCHDFDPDFAQLIAYDLCVLEYGHLHHWMAFFDVDEFMVFTNPADSAIDNLPTLLQAYEGHGGLAVSYRMFGSGALMGVMHCLLGPSYSVEYAVGL